MQASSQGIQVQFTVTIPVIKPHELQFDPDLQSGADRTELGRGGCGIVYAGHYQGQPVAIKTLHVTTSKVVQALYEEAAVMFRTTSPYTVKLQGICSTPKVTSLVMERMMGGSLFHLLQDESKELPWALRYRLAYEIAEGLWALHAQEILHRDLKSLNVLLDEEQHAKITDFGFSKLRGQVTSVAPSSNKASLGTLAYKSPELMEADSDSDDEAADAAMPVKKAVPYSPYSDIYAYGMILWELATRCVPFAELSQRKIEKMIKKGKQLPVPADCPPEFAALIKSCWAMKPGQRPRTDAIVAQTKAWYEASIAVPVVPVPEEKEDYQPESWYVHPDIRAQADEDIKKSKKHYALVPAGDYDIQKVVAAYQLCPLPQQSIKSVNVIYNPRLNRGFGLMLDTLNARHGKGAFAPKWRDEKGQEGAWRETTHQVLEALSKPHQDTHNPHVTLVPMWHATNEEILPSLFETGFASLALVDTGFFGKGIYSTAEAKYAQTVYGKMYDTPALLLNWVASFSAYPVIDGDMPELQGKGNYANHDAHFIPVRPANPKDPNESNFYPCRTGEKHTYTEMVVFQSAQCMPRYVVELQSDLLPSPQVVVDAKVKQQAEQQQKSQAEEAAKQAEKLKAAQHAKEQAEKAKQAESAEKEKAKQIEAEKAAAVKKAVEESEKAAAIEKSKIEAQAAKAEANMKAQAEAAAKAQAEEMQKLKEELAAEKKKLAEEKEKAVKAKEMAEKLAAEKAQVEADQKYAEKIQAEQTKKALAQEERQKAEAEEAEKEKGRAEDREKRAQAEEKEGHEAQTEGRVKVVSHFFKPAQAASPHVTTFLRLVAEGEQDKAEAMLKENPRLALAAGKVTDLSKRTFNNITGLQYALWALDWNMWMMILKYMPKEEAQIQAMALDESGTEHGKHFDFSQLLGAYKAYEKGFNGWNDNQRETHWCQQVGGAQLLLPAHAVNEYCRPDRAFYPVPDFTKEGLPRVREVEGMAGSDAYLQQYNGGKLGSKWALYRGRVRKGDFGFLKCVCSSMVWMDVDIECAAVAAMSEARVVQHQSTMKELLTNKPVIGKKGKG